MTSPEEKLIALLAARGKTLSAAESCTGGMISSRLVGVPGASAVFAGGVVSYQTRVKTSLLGVLPETVDRHTVVSAEVAAEMAAGAAKALGTDFAVSVTGLAGPGGGTEEIPVGTVHIGFSLAGTVTTRCFRFPGGREEVRRAAADAALSGLYELISNMTE